MAETKAINTVVLDTGPIIKNEPSISTVLAQSEAIYTTKAVVDEIKDSDTRSRLEATVLPFLKLREPQPANVKAVADFAKKTGDYEVLSRTDLHLLALSYELECERNGGDWRLRSVPGQKKLNGPCPTTNSTTATPLPSVPALEIAVDDGQKEETESDSDSEGWITPSNLKRHQQKETTASQVSAPRLMQVATITTDFAMQNVLLQMNLNLLSPNLDRINNVRSYILRCHACFLQTRDMGEQFCPRCGKPTLLRTSCSVSANGEFKIHLKKNMQWNTRGDRYSIPKPVSGSANGAAKGGGKGGWGQDLILVGDQKEFTRATSKKRQEQDLMDRDYLPSLLTGERKGSGTGRPTIGAGRNVNSRRRKR